MATLVFIVILSVLILVHELGHFLMAKRVGVKVEKFSLGFGPKLFSKMIDGTEFALCLIPLGGYVKMAGDEKTNCTGASHEYYSKSPGHRALIVLLGPLVNYLLAFLCFWLVFIVGYPTVTAKVGELLKGFPAEHSGLQVGDKIIRAGNQPMTCWEDLQKYISKSKGNEIPLEVIRQGEVLNFKIKPTIRVLENVFGQKESVPLIGIRPDKEIILLKYNIGKSFLKAADRFVEITGMTYKAIYRMATGAMSAKDSVTGPIGIFYIIKEAADMGFSYVVYILGVISLSLAIFNLLPFPALDGGHLVLLTIEKMRGKPLSVKADEMINRVGFSLIILLALFVFYSDFVRYGIIDKIMSLWKKIGL